MGQQQLILLVLATVIVGIAIVVGIRAFTENSAKSNADAMTQTAVRIANDAQAWKKKPAPFGGQASLSAANAVDEDNFTGATWDLLGYTDTDGSATTYTNLDGVFTLTAGTTSLLITGQNNVEDNTVSVIACGMDDSDIVGNIVVLNGATVGAAATCPTTTTTTN